MGSNNSRFRFRDLSSNPPADSKEVLRAYRDLDNAVKSRRRHVYADERLTPKEVAQLQKQGLDKLHAVQKQMREMDALENKRPPGSDGKGLARRP